MKTELKYDDYKIYEVPIPYIRDGFNYRFKFDNNYGASVIKHKFSYGYEDDLFELAVLYFDKNDRPYITYSTPITDDVIGNLTNEEVLELLERIKNL